VCCAYIVIEDEGRKRRFQVRWRKVEATPPFIGLERRHDVGSRRGIARQWWATFIASVSEDKGKMEQGVAMVRRSHFGR
jgi:hypothetical protein